MGQTLWGRAVKPPPNTCPQIDAISVQFDAVSGDLETFRDNVLEFRSAKPDEVSEIVGQTIDALQEMRTRLEALREANEALRECGKYWYQETQRAKS